MKWTVFIRKALPLYLAIIVAALFTDIALGAVDVGDGDDSYIAVVVDGLGNGAAYFDAVQSAITTGENAYTSLEGALDAANPGQLVILIQYYSITKNVTVKSGVTLLLPCEPTLKAYEANGYNPDGTNHNNGDNPDIDVISADSNVFVSLTIPMSYHMTVYGTVLVNAETGCPNDGQCSMGINGGYSEINLYGGITVKSGGTFDSSGLVNGTGVVTAEEGAVIYDVFITKDWKGVEQAQLMVGEGIFPFNEYDCRNIRSELVINYGASYQATLKSFGNGSFYYSRFALVDNENGLVSLNSAGYMSKSSGKYNPEYSIYGGASFNSTYISLVGMNLSTGDFLFPIDGDLKFYLYNGKYSVDEDIKFLPGAAVYVCGGAELIVGGMGDVMVVFYDSFESAKYQQSQPAALTLLEGAKLTVYGTFAGKIMSTARAGGLAQVTLIDGCSLTAVTKETDTSVVGFNCQDLYFEMSFYGLDGYVPYPGTAYFYSNGWHGGDLSPGGISYSGRVTLQGRGDYSDTEVVLSYYGKTFSTTTDKFGNFLFTDIDLGCYTISITKSGYLGYSKENVVILSDGAFGDKNLSGGDLDNSGYVDYTDLNVLLSSYNMSGDGDINGDGFCNVTDLDILIKNFGKASVAE